MTRIEVAPEVGQDFDRFFEHVAQFDPGAAVARLDELMRVIDVLATSPLIGRSARAGQRELVIGRVVRGHVALYRYVPEIDTVFLLALRSQREAGYKHGD